MFVALTTVAIGASTVWVLFDARKLGITKSAKDGFLNLDPAGWAWCCALMWVFCFPLYLAVRGRLKRKFGAAAKATMSPVRTAAHAVAISALFSLLTAVELGVRASDLSPEDRFPLRSMYVESSEGNAPEPARITVGTFLTHFHHGDWEPSTDSEGGRVYRIHITDQLTHRSREISYEFLPGPDEGSATLTRMAVDGEPHSGQEMLAILLPVIIELREAGPK